MTFSSISGLMSRLWLRRSDDSNVTAVRPLVAAHTSTIRRTRVGLVTESSNRWNFAVTPVRGI